MSVRAACDLGWFVSHQQSIDSAYSMAYPANHSCISKVEPLRRLTVLPVSETFSDNAMREECYGRNKSDVVQEESGAQRETPELQSCNFLSNMRRYRCKRDLFAIYHPYLMDTQFTKLLERRKLSSSHVASDDITFENLPNREICTDNAIFQGVNDTIQSVNTFKDKTSPNLITQSLVQVNAAVEKQSFIKETDKQKVI